MLINIETSVTSSIGIKFKGPGSIFIFAIYLQKSENWSGNILIARRVGGKITRVSNIKMFKTDFELGEKAELKRQFGEKRERKKTKKKSYDLTMAFQIKMLESKPSIWVWLLPDCQYIRSIPSYMLQWILSWNRRVKIEAALMRVIKRQVNPVQQGLYTDDTSIQTINKNVDHLHEPCHLLILIERIRHFINKEQLEQRL